jgi:hypothetical protein
MCTYQVGSGGACVNAVLNSLVCHMGSSDQMSHLTLLVTLEQRELECRAGPRAPTHLSSTQPTRLSSCQLVFSVLP